MKGNSRQRRSLTLSQAELTFFTESGLDALSVVEDQVGLDGVLWLLARVQGGQLGDPPSL